VSAHAKLSPSAADRWMVCAGSVEAEDGLPDDTSAEAAEGTFAHSISEDCLALGLDPFDFIGHRAKVEGHSFEWGEDDAEQLAFGIAEVRAFGGKFFGEHRVDMSKWLGPDQFGTLDRAIILPDLIVIDDLKWGRGIPVSPIENRQLSLYGLGFWHDIARHHTDATDFLIIIDQPRCGGGGGHWRTTLEQLLEFGEEARAAAERALAPGASRTASEKGCRFCKRRGAPGGCPTLDAFMLELFGKDFDDLDDEIIIGGPMELPVVITPERRSFILDNRKLCESWFDKLHAQTLDDALNGRDAGGKKAVEGRKSPDKWKDIESADATLVPFLGEGRFNHKIKTPTQVLKELKLKDFPDELEPLVERGQRKPSLVSVQDARPALLNNLEQMFDDLED
jgi:hypothetical protein